MSDGKKIAAVLCVLRAESEVLLLRRTKSLHYGKYVPPGGKIDPHEPAREAALREAFEETGVRLEEMTFRGVLQETSPTDYNWITYIYSADIERFEPPACNEGVLEWVPLDRVTDLPTYAVDHVVYRFYREGRPFVLDARYDGEMNLLSVVDELSGERIAM